ncbi:MAG: sporulation protein YunB [Clostridia bacterium]|nr:sporulation protein YunB [Clostridia bacterium]
MSRPLLLCGNYKYEDISNVIRDEQGNIKMIQMNVITVNAITSDVAIKIQQELNNYKSEEFYIRLGTFTGTKILAGRGPNVPIKMSTIGNVDTELVSQFSQAGINQTLHRIYLNVSCTVTVLTPFDSIEQKITNQVLIAEAVILGDVPETYYNLNGVKSDELIELVE